MKHITSLLCTFGRSNAQNNLEVFVGPRRKKHWRNRNFVTKTAKRVSCFVVHHAVFHIMSNLAKPFVLSLICKLYTHTSYVHRPFSTRQCASGSCWHLCSLTMFCKMACSHSIVAISCTGQGKTVRNMFFLALKENKSSTPSPHSFPHTLPWIPVNYMR